MYYSISFKCKYQIFFSTSALDFNAFRYDRNWSLSDSMSELAERLAAEGVIIEECDPQVGIEQKRGFRMSGGVYMSRSQNENYTRPNSGVFGHPYNAQRHSYYASNCKFLLLFFIITNRFV